MGSPPATGVFAVVGVKVSGTAVSHYNAYNNTANGTINGAPVDLGLPEAGFRFFAVPVKVKGMGTFPVRAFGLVPGANSTERQPELVVRRDQLIE